MAAINNVASDSARPAIFALRVALVYRLTHSSMGSTTRVGVYAAGIGVRTRNC